MILHLFNCEPDVFSVALNHIPTAYSTVRNLLVIHFIKRFLESAFVHSFSRATVPLSFVFRK